MSCVTSLLSLTLPSLLFYRRPVPVLFAFVLWCSHNMFLKLHILVSRAWRTKNSVEPWAILQAAVNSKCCYENSTKGE